MLDINELQEGIFYQTDNFIYFIIQCFSYPKTRKKKLCKAVNFTRHITFEVATIPPLPT